MEISKLVQQCLHSFRNLSSLEPDDQQLADQVTDEFGRFRVWAGNASAHSTGFRSLQYRLRDSSELSSAVLQYLESLLEALGRVPTSSSSGHTDEALWTSSSSMQAGESDDDDTLFGPLVFGTSGNEALEEASEIISCLLRVSMAFRNPARNDQIRHDETVNTDYFEPYDVEHVKTKFTSASRQLIERYVKSSRSASPSS
jgi:hypothetical protein